MISINKKIRNATVNKQGNITFKSILENTCFNTLIEAGFNPLYEPKKHVVFPSFKPITPFYDKETDSQHEKRVKELGKSSPKLLRLCDGIIQNITYLPDIYLKYKDIDAWIESKAFSKAVFPYKRKLFRQYIDDILTDTRQKSIYFQVYSKKLLFQAI